MVSYEVLTLVLIFSRLCYDIFNHIANKCCMLYIRTFVKHSDNVILVGFVKKYVLSPNRDASTVLTNPVRSTDYCTTSSSTC